MSLEDGIEGKYIEAVARVICEQTLLENLCGANEDRHHSVCARSCLSCRNVARAVISTYRIVVGPIDNSKTAP
jgi:hypothetical protein